MSETQGAASSGGHKAHRGTRHLRVGLQIGQGDARVSSIWVVEQPAVQHARLVEPVLAQVEVAGQPVLVEAFADPRVSRGVYMQGRGHSYSVSDTGTVFVSVPFSDLTELSDLRIRLVDASNAKAPAADALAAAPMFQGEVEGARLLGEVDVADLQKHPDWPKVADTLGVAAETGRFEVYVDTAGEYRWRLRRPDGQIVADSGEGYRKRQECEADLRWVRGNAATANVIALDAPGSAGA